MRKNNWRLFAVLGSSVVVLTLVLFWVNHMLTATTSDYLVEADDLEPPKKLIVADVHEPVLSSSKPSSNDIHWQKPETRTAQTHDVKDDVSKDLVSKKELGRANKIKMEAAEAEKAKNLERTLSEYFRIEDEKELKRLKKLARRVENDWRREMHRKEVLDKLKEKYPDKYRERMLRYQEDDAKRARREQEKDNRKLVRLEELKVSDYEKYLHKKETYELRAKEREKEKREMPIIRDLLLESGLLVQR